MKTVEKGVAKVSFESLTFLHFSIDHHSIERCVVVVFAKKFCGPFFVRKRAEIFDSFRNRFHIPHCPPRFVTFDAIFLQTYLQDTFAFCLLPSGVGNVVIYWAWSFGQPKAFYRWVFVENNWKPRLFHGASVTLSLFSGLISQVCRPKASTAMERKIRLHSGFACFFCFSPGFWPKNSVEKHGLQKKVSALYNIWSVHHASKWCMSPEIKNMLFSASSRRFWYKF